MDYQLKAEPQESSSFFYDGMVMRAPVPGTVARGSLVEDPALLTGKDAVGEFLAANPLTVDDALLERGKQRYTIYCQPCHDKRGLGKGIMLERGSVPTASFHDEQRSAYPDGQLFDIITNGSGLMEPYRGQVPPAVRWAIVAHIRRLQQERQGRLALAGPTGERP
jgi:mono/diheme cytochrome c family protein